MIFGKDRKMKTIYGIILILATAAAISMMTPAPCGALEDDDLFWVEEQQEPGHGRFELTDEKIELIMSRLAKTDPKKAEELKELRDKEPEQFRAEIRKVIYDEHRKRIRKSTGYRDGPKDIGEKGRRGPRQFMREHHREHLKWLRENYPEEAKELEQIQGRDADLYMRKLGHSIKRYGRIEDAMEENPKLAEALKTDLELKDERDRLLRKIDTAGDDEKKKLVAELENVVSKRFDLIVERKKIEFEQMRKRLERLEKHIQNCQSKFEKWQDPEFKKQNVKERVEELVSKADKFIWE
jgi:hypothetical protein